jgi:ATP-binding cassette, subfamily B, multidrug efflux pump
MLMGGDGVAKRRPLQSRATQHEYAYLYVNHPFKWFWNLILPVRGRFLLTLGIDLVLISAVVVPATLTGRLVDRVLIQRQMSLLPLYLGLMVIVPLLRSSLNIFVRYQFEYCSQDSVMRLKESLYQHLQELDANFYNRSKTGDIMTKMTGDIDWVRHFIAFTAFASIENLVLFIGGSLYILTISWKLALAALILTPVILILTYRLGRLVRPAWGDIREALSSLNSVVQQNIAGNRIVKAFARKDFEEKKFEAENDRFRQANINQNRIATRFLPLLEALANFLTVPVILIGGYLVISGELTLGGLVTFSGLLFVLNNPMRAAGNLMNEIQRYSTSANKVIDLLMERSRIVNPDPDKAREELEKQQGHTAQAIRGKVEFRDVTFFYGETSGQVRHPALANISLVAEPGQTIGIIGLTGSGKTSLAQLIPRLYDPSSGTVLIDDIDVRKMNLQFLRRAIGMVMQDVFLFSDTVEGNIAYGVPDASFKQVEHAAEIAATGFIDSMANGYDTIVGERGAGLSGGQRQRIALARALAMHPKILILDDTTSAVDMETEYEIQQAMQNEPDNRTVFIIAHRISSVRRADQILVMDHGRVVERGTHEQLLAGQGIYHDVFLTQAGLDQPAAPEPAPSHLPGGSRPERRCQDGS